MRQVHNFYHLTALPRGNDAECWIGHTYARKANAERFAKSCRDIFRRITVWKGGPGGEIVSQWYPTLTVPDALNLNGEALPEAIPNPWAALPDATPNPPCECG